MITSMEINYKDWIEITNKIFDQEVVGAEAVFLHGYLDLREETLNFVTATYKKSGAKYLVLNGAGENEFGPYGFIFMKGEFVKRAIPEENIFGIPPAYNTREEALGYMNFAKEKSIKRGIVISAPMFVIRAFLTNVAFIKEWNLDIKLYPTTFKNIDWQEKVILRPYSFDKPDTKYSKCKTKQAIIKHRVRLIA